MTWLQECFKKKHVFGLALTGMFSWIIGSNGRIIIGTDWPIIISSNGPIITGSDGQIITGTIVYPILFTGSMNLVNPYHVTQCDRSVAHIIWYTVTCLPDHASQTNLRLNWHNWTWRRLKPTSIPPARQTPSILHPQRRSIHSSSKCSNLHAQLLLHSRIQQVQETLTGKKFSAILQWTLPILSLVSSWHRPSVTFRITDPTPSPSPPKTLCRRIVDHQTLPVVRSLFLSGQFPSLWHPTINEITITLSFGTSLVNRLCPTHASLLSISDYC